MLRVVQSEHYPLNLMKLIPSEEEENRNKICYSSLPLKPHPTQECGMKVAVI